MSNRVQFLRYDIPPTKADRIRAMSDEELADEFFRFGDCAYTMGVYKKSGCLDTREEILKWLKQPAEEPGGLNNNEDF